MDSQKQKFENATFAGGCFWCTEAFFKEVRGVLSVIPGYAGGEEKNPSYTSIHMGGSKHAECVHIAFDPERVPYEVLVNIFFGTHDPTQVNGQGNDIGEEYRSIIFYHSNEQKQTAEKIKSDLEKQGVFSKPITTTIEPFEAFYPAEDEHKNFYERNPNQPYCQIVIDPKIAKFRKHFAAYVQHNP